LNKRPDDGARRGKSFRSESIEALFEYLKEHDKWPIKDEGNNREGGGIILFAQQNTPLKKEGGAILFFFRSKRDALLSSR